MNQKHFHRRTWWSFFIEYFNFVWFEGSWGDKWVVCTSISVTATIGI